MLLGQGCPHCTWGFATWQEIWITDTNCWEKNISVKAERFHALFFLIKSLITRVFEEALLCSNIRCSTSLWESTNLCLRIDRGSGEACSWMIKRGWEESEPWFCLCLSYRWWWCVCYWTRDKGIQWQMERSILSSAGVFWGSETIPRSLCKACSWNHHQRATATCMMPNCDGKHSDNLHFSSLFYIVLELRRTVLRESQCWPLVFPLYYKLWWCFYLS